MLCLFVRGLLLLRKNELILSIIFFLGCFVVLYAAVSMLNWRTDSSEEVNRLRWSRAAVS